MAEVATPPPDMAVVFRKQPDTGYSRNRFRWDYVGEGVRSQEFLESLLGKACIFSFWKGVRVGRRTTGWIRLCDSWGNARKEHRMSKHEPEFTQRYWKKNWKNKGGTLIEEFPAVRPPARNSPFGKRDIDGVIVLDGQGRHLTTQDGLKVDGKILRPPKNGSLHEVRIKGQKIIVVQTKMGSPTRPYRLGMCLLGQALFSKHLMEEQFHPKTTQSVAVCGRRDRIMKDQAKKYEIDVVVYVRRRPIQNCDSGI